MSSTFQSFTTSRLGLAMAMGFGRIIPPVIGYRIATFLADRIASRKQLSIVQVVRANQWVISGEKLNGMELDQAVKETFRHTARSIYDVYHHLDDMQAMVAKINFSPRFDELIERHSREKQGVVAVIPHMSNFDLVGLCAASRGARGIGLGFPGDVGGYKWQNRLRSRYGLEAFPTSIKSLKMATKSLRAGGLVLTGMDRPVPESKYQLTFFGRPANLPVHHVLLAQQANVPIIVAAAIMDSEGIYHLQISEFLEMRRRSDRRSELLDNAQRVLEIAEGYIKQAPRQWAMYFPVWPEIMAHVP